MPAGVLRQARHALEALESQQQASRAQIDLFAAPAAAASTEPSAVEMALSKINPDALSPKDALDALYRLKNLLNP